MGEYDMVVGTYLLGIFVNTFLFGLVCYQFLEYKNTKFNDPTWIKAMVGILFSVDLLHSSVEIYGAWDMCVTNYTNPGSLAFIYWVVPFTAATTAVTALIAQIFLGHRVLLLTKSVILTTIIGIFSVSGCIFGITAGIKSGIIREVAKFAPLAPFVILWLSLQTAADLLITASLTVVLCRSRSSVHRSDIVNRLIRAAIQTGFFVSLFALGDLFSFLFLRETNWYAFFAFPIGRIYTNTMLDTLISRRSIKQTLGSTFDMDSESNGVAFRMNPRDSITLNTMITTKDMPNRDTEQGVTDTRFSIGSNNEMYRS